uniref:Uncharacterized protein n=1 Tax=Phaseolus vulgaris TaxID=3885 RepID=D2DW64_PHAVU|nr:hypothetical protein [Phaseolus vulgaris]
MAIIGLPFATKKMVIEKMLEFARELYRNSSSEPNFKPFHIDYRRFCNGVGVAELSMLRFRMCGWMDVYSNQKVQDQRHIIVAKQLDEKLELGIKLDVGKTTGKGLKVGEVGEWVDSITYESEPSQRGGLWLTHFLVLSVTKRKNHLNTCSRSTKSCVKRSMDDNSVEYLDQRNKIVFKQGKVDAEEIFHMAQLKTLLNVRTQHKDQEIGSCPLTSHFLIGQEGMPQAKETGVTMKEEDKAVSYAGMKGLVFQQ